jgi:hypothetical protein
MGSLTVALCGYLLSVPLPLQLHQLISGVQVQGLALAGAEPRQKLDPLILAPLPTQGNPQSL